MRFWIYRPFEMARNGAALSRERKDKQEFWNSVEACDPGLPNACGCYVFVIRGKAWYIGMAEGQSFKKEIFQHHKLLLYSEALQLVNGRAQFIFLAKATAGARFSKPSSANLHRDIPMLEKLIIGLALRRNKKLRNVKDTKLLREMRVPGLLNTGKGEGKANGVKALRRALGA